jgi:lipopolysaccharide biosynthesis glycosyltransferase
VSGRHSGETALRALVFALDDDYLLGFRVLWQSLRMTDSLPAGQSVYFLHESSLSSKSRNLVVEAVKDAGCTARFLDATPLLPAALPIHPGEHVSRATFYRLFAHCMLPAEVTSCVYLDCDLLALRSCRTLFEEPLTAPLAACDHCAPRISLALWGPEGGSYFQAGVLLMNLAQWRAESMDVRFLQILAQERSRIQFWDQDVLNLAFRDVWQRLPVWWNVNQDVVASQPASVLRQEARIAHFDNPFKPWNSRTSRLFASDWDRVCGVTPGVSFQPPNRNITLVDRMQFHWRRLTRRFGKTSNAE